MEEGYIEKYFSDKKFGRIRIKDSKVFVNFKLDEFKKLVSGKEPVEGAKVAVNYDKKDRNKINYLEILEDKNFVNPYNFVRYLDSTKNDFLKKCSNYKDSDEKKYSGRITCELDIVTPIHILGKEMKNEDGHFTHDFYSRDGENYVIPASGLKGPVRSVYEAATNSCFSVMNREKFARRMKPSINELRNLVPSIIIKKDKEYYLKKLEGKSRLNITQVNYINKKFADRGVEIDRSYIPLKAAWIKKYKPKKYEKPYDYLNTDKFEDGEVWAVMEPDISWKRDKKGDYVVKFVYWKVVKFFKKREEAEENRKNLQIIGKGYVYITGQNMQNKHDEKFFFSTPEDDEHEIKLDDKVIKEYKNVINDYKEHHKKEIEKLSKNDEIKHKKQNNKFKLELSRFILEDEKKDDKILVYAKSGGEKIDFVIPVQLSRIMYKNAPYDLLSKEQQLCESVDFLCPACRVFGWVGQGGEKDEKREEKNGNRVLAYAGKVFFSDVNLEIKYEDKKMYILSELSNPKPTTTNFYLSRNNKEDFIGKDKGYNDKSNSLRGRKFYYHHKGSISEIKENATVDESGKTDRNKTVRVIESGKGNFEIDFVNLTELELGSLLWSLELENEMFHKIGMGKPLGLGSIKITIKKIEYKNKEKYKKFDAKTYKEIYNDENNATDEKKNIINKFKRIIENFDNIKDLKIILSGDVDDLKIHYPRKSSKADRSGDNKSFQWFKSAEDKKVKFPFVQNSKKGLPYNIDSKSNGKKSNR